ncbi:uncharacterized protein M421DRAFT_5261 [Didymella exigua CBS 183.55]|uniref:Telomeric single stranded DNA binding POT1/Cdc13 domain-containing protein n=1 Tax=Didymella exigua CBS 183.55 TaxID=1150837 RepID=A0A6A5RM48_9PLEO|nr:uncharacterized protein M421DRAFT_5261 [Didymella exigua CBS 183.55]KAF1928188.1 hypothetical protein M421DRAFT_5261 [Didymella exigua CBS 183.55]
MEHVHIAALRPNVDALESKQIKAVVTLIWPYSSSQRQFALLLAEPDLRLRRKNGQVRAHFSSTSARALATTGVGIGDEVVLGLHGAQFVQDGAVGTPGKRIDWELAYTQTLAISVRRDGAEIANLELIDAAPTPAPRSPVKKPAAAPSPMPQWSSPAFLRRARLSDRPSFEQPAFDPLADAYNGTHDKKRRRKSYRDWTAWTYTTRTPSPEKEHVAIEDDLEEAMSSPSRRPQLPRTPVSPSRTEAMSAAAEAREDLEYVEETTIADSAEDDTTIDDGELQKVYAPLSTTPERRQRDAVPQIEYDGAPLDSQYDFGGDTELNTEDEEDDEEDEDVTVPDVEAVDVSATEVATELEDEPEEVEDEPSIIEAEYEITDVEANATEEDSEPEVEPERPEEVSEGAEDTTIDETVAEVVETATVAEESLTVAMPPPSLPDIYTGFAAPSVTDLLTPIGREPSSPNLKAVDSATLPLPSPFPGEQAISYFEHISVGRQQAPLDGPVVQQELAIDDDADYIMENSFFSSISSSRGGGLHQDHETAFTPVRFTFGMDGAGWSRPLELSSPPPEDAPPITIKEPAPTAFQDEENIEREEAQPALAEQFELVEDVSYSSLAGTFDGDVTSAVRARNETEEVVPEPAQTPVEPIFGPAEADPTEAVPKSSNMVVLSSDVEYEDCKDEVEDEIMAEPEMDRTTEEETESESEEKAESESKFESGSVLESEAETDEIDAQHAPPASYEGRKGQESPTTSFESEAEDEQPQSQQDDTFVATQTSVAVSEVVDLGSPSADGGSDTDHNDSPSIASIPVQTVNEAEPNDPTETAQDLEDDNTDLRVGPIVQPTSATSHKDLNFDDFVGQDITQKSTVVLSSSPDGPIREPASISIPDTYDQPLSVEFDDWEPQLGMDEPLPFIGEENPLRDIEDSPGGAQADAADVLIEEAADTRTDAEHSEVKTESVEDGSSYLISQSQDVPQESATDPATELWISVPENGHKLGEIQYKSVPATAPARNTRSKAKSAASPIEEEGYVSRISTSVRRIRSKASFDSTNRDATSPTQSRGPPRSTTTTGTQDVTHTSPYSLRSQSKQLSPDQSVTAPQLPARRSPRKLERRDTDFDIVPSQVENRDLFGSIFEPSQELGFGYSQLSQGRYSDVGFVKDSEENTSHSESSISTVHASDDDVGRANRSDPAEVTDDLQPATPQLKPPPSFLQSQRQTRSRSRSMRQQSVVSPIQPPQSPRRSPRLTRSTFSSTPSPRIARTLKAAVQVSPPVPEVVDEDQGREDTSKAKEQSIVYPILSAESRGNIHSSPLAPASAQTTLQESNLLTPDETQQTAAEPPLSFQARQPEQSHLITPDLTQTTSATATLRSFDVPLPGVETQPAPHSPILRTSPRRKPATTEPKSTSPAQQSSPIYQSSSAISAEDQDATLVTKPEPPSLGLSTPLAYYTPLRDLIYFLNRSSQFHSAANPDILALCTSSSITPAQATNGPRDWTTSLSVTDLSIWPQTRRVDVFRAYQTALPAAEVGDVVLLRAFKVESRRREPRLRSAEESSWCVWRYGKPVWGKKGGRWGELRAREEVKGPAVERGLGEWAEVEKLRGWYVGIVKEVLEEREAERLGLRRELRGGSKGADVQVDEVKEHE